MSPSRPLRVWVFNQHYPPDAVATAGVLETICRGLARRGWLVTVFPGAPLLNPGRTAAPAGPRMQDGVRVVQLPTINRRRTTADRLLHYGSWTIGAAAAWLRSDPPDVVVALTTPPVLAGLAASLGTSLRDVPFVWNVQDLFPDILETSRYHDTWIERAARAVARWPEARATAFVAVGAAMADRLRERLPGHRIEVIPNPVDIRAIRPIPPTRNSWRKRLGLPEGTFLAVYAGNLGHAQGIEQVLDAAQLLESDPEIHIAIVGEGAARDQIARAVASRPNVTLHSFEPTPTEVLAAGDIGLVPLRPGMINYLLPSKAVQYLAAGTPIAAAATTGDDLQRLVNEADCGYCWPPGDAESLAACLRAAANNPASLPEMAARGRAWVETHASGRIAVDRWDALLRDVAVRETRHRD